MCIIEVFFVFVVEIRKKYTIFAPEFCSNGGMVDTGDLKSPAQ